MKRYLVLLFLFLGIVTITKSQGKIVFELPPGVDNPRNSEGDCILLKDGRLLFVYSRYHGTSASDHGTAVLAGRYSSDNGATWTSTDDIIVEQEGTMNVMSVSLLRLSNGEIALFYLRKNSVLDCVPMVRFSQDEGKTWSAPKCITDKTGYFVLNNDRVIQLTNGRLIMAVALHDTSNGIWKSEAALYTYYSDDNGKSWNSSEKVPNLTNRLTQEPGIIELKDGRVLMFIRSNDGVQRYSYSEDSGHTWSHIEDTNIYSPIAPASMARIPQTGDLLLVWNNMSKKSDETKGRTPLAVAISKDEGKTWQNIKNIETDPDGWYCYTSITFVEDEVLLTYCAGSQSKRTYLNTIRFRKMNVDAFYSLD